MKHSSVFSGVNIEAIFSGYLQVLEVLLTINKKKDLSQILYRPGFFSQICFMFIE